MAWIGLAGCATTAASNYRVTYHHAGAANETAEADKAAEQAFHAEANEPRKRAIARTRVYLDSLPRELTLKNNVVEVRAGEAATLVASVEVTAVWRAPSDDAGVIPALQKAAESVGADLAFCPRDEKPTYYSWRCYLVKSGAPAH